MELAGDVPRPVGPHRAALSLVTDRETMGQLWACPLYSVLGRRVSLQSPGFSVWLSLPLLVGRSQAECVCGCTVSHLSASSSKIGQKVQQCIEMIWKKEVNRGEDMSDEPMERKLDVRFIQGSM